MQNSSGVSELKMSSEDSRAVEMAKRDSLTITKYAAHIGFSFAERYYTVMRTTPEYANEFYDEHGEYQTIYENGSAVVARNRSEVKRILIQPVSATHLIVNSIVSVPCGGTFDRLLVTVTGKRFVHVFVAEYRPERMLGYVIVGSLFRYVSAEPAAPDQTTTGTKCATAVCHPVTGVNHTPSASLKAKTPVNFSPNLVEHNKPLPDTITDYAPTAGFKATQKIRCSSNVAIYHKPLPDTAIDDIPTRGFNATQKIRCPPNVAIYHKPLPDTAIDDIPTAGFNATQKIRCSPNGAIYHKPHPNTVIDDKSTAGFNATQKIRCSPNRAIYHKPLLDTAINDIPTASFKETQKIRCPPNVAIYHKPLPDTAIDDIPTAGFNATQKIRCSPNGAIYHKPLPETNSTKTVIAKEKSLISILKRIPPPPKIATFHEPSSWNTGTGNTHPHHTTRNRSPIRISNHVPNPATFGQQFPISFNHQVPLGVFQPIGNVPLHTRLPYAAPNFPLTINGEPHQQWAGTQFQHQIFHLPSEVGHTNN
ncbi:Nuclear transport factor 2, eukaryote,NTF2-like domain [Cinara cedri]|uniref:Nuclear transport factor 2, eukaryote,NTF2-like domain n=1 Tax=Cinara cedri TaxID=506608 RepID=A0A5E4MEC2_9HEMI|nr:Nuclear transport factor 2, eukaryote,NTF2-like domain [Cinara cedri]